LTGLHRSDNPINQALPAPSQNTVVERYQPWGRVDAGVPTTDKNPFNLAYRDPLVWGSDNWDFPGNKYPTIGWLGRVHRGTPWQTVYLKSTNIINYLNLNLPVGYVTWMNWLGDADGFDAVNSGPVQDNRLFDIFTTALNDNATRGTLSVNQTHLAAWSAVLSGLVALTNVTVGDLGPDPSVNSIPTNGFVVIDPAGIDATTNSPVWNIVNGPNGINATRADTNIFVNTVFTRVGDLLRVPALTEQSPFINRSDSAIPNDRLNYDISDEVYEQIPQQILGLLRVGSSRYVIYCYGQTLHPAPDGTVLGGSFFGMVTNYQVVAESAARAVVSVHPVLTNTVINGATVPVTNYTTRVESFNMLPPD